MRLRASIRRWLVVPALAAIATAGMAVPVQAIASGDDVVMNSFVVVSPSTLRFAGFDECDVAAGALFEVAATNLVTGATATTSQTVACPPAGSTSNWSTDLTLASGTWGMGQIKVYERLKTLAGVGLAGAVQQVDIVNLIDDDFQLVDGYITRANGSVTETGQYRCPAGTTRTLTFSAAESSAGASGTGVETVSCTGAFTSFAVTANPSSPANPFTLGSVTGDLLAADPSGYYVGEVMLALIIVVCISG